MNFGIGFEHIYFWTEGGMKREQLEPGKAYHEETMLHI